MRTIGYICLSIITLGIHPHYKLQQLAGRVEALEAANDGGPVVG